MFPSSSTFQLSLLSCKSIFLHFFGCHIGSVWEIFSFFYDKSFFNRVNYECIKGAFNIIRPENLARDALIINETNQIIFTRRTNVETILWQIWMVLFCLKSLSYLVHMIRICVFCVVSFLKNIMFGQFFGKYLRIYFVRQWILALNGINKKVTTKLQISGFWCVVLLFLVLEWIKSN